MPQRSGLVQVPGSWAESLNYQKAEDSPCCKACGK